MGIEYRISGCEPILVALSLWLEVNALYNVHSSNKIKNKIMTHSQNSSKLQ
jgi:hypothetical protein